MPEVATTALGSHRHGQRLGQPAGPEDDAGLDHHRGVGLDRRPPTSVAPVGTWNPPRPPAGIWTLVPVGQGLGDPAAHGRHRTP